MKPLLRALRSWMAQVELYNPNSFDAARALALNHEGLLKSGRGSSVIRACISFWNSASARLSLLGAVSSSKTAGKLDCALDRVFVLVAAQG